MTTILLLSGPNLDELGLRSPEIYGSESLDSHVARVRELAEGLGYVLRHRQSNFEGDLIEEVHAARGEASAIIINPGALTHTSWALSDALASFPGVALEVHLSNPAAREEFRHTSTVASVVDGTIAGLGGLGYDLALEAAHRLLQRSNA